MRFGPSACRTYPVARLGMPPDVVARAREGLSTGQRDLETVLADLRAQLTAAETRAAEATAARDEAEHLRVCAFADVECPRGCGVERVLREHIKEHLHDACVYRDVVCDEVGCGGVLRQIGRAHV